MPHEKIFDFPSPLILGFEIIVGRVKKKKKLTYMLYIEKEPDWDLSNLGHTEIYIFDVQFCVPKSGLGWHSY